jgi:chemotaxis protein histidine kinase CheA/ActR/RegA family two-component response regulator
MQETTAVTASQRLHALTVISASLHGELKDVATKLSAFSDTPKANPLSPNLSMMYRAASFCGFWGVANYLGGLRELSLRIETVPPETIDRAEYIERVKTLAAGINALGLYLRDLAGGSAVSYAALNEQFGRVIRKARPALLELPANALVPVLFMPAPPSMEVDAHWVSTAGASRETLVAALRALLEQEPGEAHLRRIAASNPYRTLSGLLESAACLHAMVLQADVVGDVTDEARRLLGLLEHGEPVTPPTPDAFLFSRLMFGLASAQAVDAETKALRRRYSLTKPGASIASMHDVARKFAEGIKRFQDAYMQATLSKTPSAVAKMAASVAADSHRLESPAFTTVAAMMVELTSSWTSKEPTPADWTMGAALVLLMRESAESWGHQEAQDSLAGLADMMAATKDIFQCPTMQASMRATAVQKACDALMLDFTELNKVIEGSLRSVGNGELEEPQANRVTEVVGSKVRKHLDTVAGVARCMNLPQAGAYADALGVQALDAILWASGTERAKLFEGLSRLSLFIARLRPGSMLDMEPDEQRELDVGAAAEEAPRADGAELISPTISEVVEPDDGHAADTEVVGQADAVDNQEPAQLQVEEVKAPQQAETVVAAPSETQLHGAAQSTADVVQVDEEPEGAVEESAAAASALDDVFDEPAAVSDDIGDETQFTAPPMDVSVQPGVELAAVDRRIETAAPHSLEPAADEVDEGADDGFAFAMDAEVAGMLPPDLSSLSTEGLRKEFFDAQEGRGSRLEVSDAELLTIMFEESWECMDAIDKALASARCGGAEADGTVPEARRHIHTLKGVCRTVGLEGPGATLHAMEDRLEVMPDDGILLSQMVEPFEAAMVLVRSQLESARASFYGAAPVEAEVEAEEGGGLGPAAAEPVGPQVTEQPLEEAAEASEPPAFEQPPIDEPAAVVVPLAPAPEVPSTASTQSRQAQVARVPAPAAGGSVRIPVHLAGRMGEKSGKVLMASRRALEDQVKVSRSMRELDENLRRMSPAIRELELMAAASIASSQSQGQTQGFDPLELDRYTQMQEVVRRLVEAYEDTMGSAGALSDGLRASNVAEQERAELSDELQRGASELLLVPVASQQSRLERVVAKACSDAGRKAELVIESGSRVPAAALDKLMPVFEHILRNALAHGIEPAEVRVAAGKSPVGRIVIGAPLQDSAEGGVVRVCVRDDGAGIDLARVLSIAVKRGLVSAGAKLSDDATRELLFMPGFSTASSVSELAGRGVGLDVVRSALSSLGGVVTVNSARGKGTEFTLTLPTDAASMPVIPVSSGGFKCLLPLTLVRRIVPVSAGVDVVVDIEAGKATIAGVEHELIDMSRRVPAVGGAARAGRGHLVLMKESNIVKAVLVDSVGAQTRVVVRPLGPFVRDIPGMVAGTTMATGGAGLVVNPLQLSEISRTVGEERTGNVTPKVMVVDDSSTVRLVTSRFLKRSGFSVETARDGLEALQLLAKGSAPDVFLFDLEMPGMGGFELIAEVRRKPEFKDTPIVVITSRTAEKHRERATKLGATAYLAKPYEDAQLHEVLSRLVRVPV